MAQTEQEQIEDDLTGRLQSADRPHLSVSQLHCTTGLSPVPVWCSGNALVSINAVALHRARLVVGWVTAFGR